MKPPSPAEPVTDLRRVHIVECGEPLVDFMAVAPRLIRDRPRFEYSRQSLVRQSVATMLLRATERLSPEYRLGIIEGWRPQHIQRRMYLYVWNTFHRLHPAWSDVQLKRVVNRFTAPLHDRVPPPHTTGGAVDVALLTAEGKRVDMTSPYDGLDPKGFQFAAPRLSLEARRNREILAQALSGDGLTNYPSEYWHWSYGDQGWAYRGGHAHAIYAKTQPEGWSPPPEELIEEPLKWVDDE